MTRSFSSDSKPVAQAATRFLRAIVWGEHAIVWEMLSDTGRDHVLEAACRRGMDAVHAQRLRLGTSPAEEMDSFLTGLLQGLRVDFSSVELDHVGVGDVELRKPDRAVVMLETPATFGDTPWAAGSIELSQHDKGWLVDRVHPLVSRRE